jgi:hypothetical protein
MQISPSDILQIRADIIKRNLYLNEYKLREEVSSNKSIDDGKLNLR